MGKALSDILSPQEVCIDRRFHWDGGRRSREISNIFKSPTIYRIGWEILLFQGRFHETSRHVTKQRPRYSLAAPGCDSDEVCGSDRNTPLKVNGCKSKAKLTLSLYEHERVHEITSIFPDLPATCGTGNHFSYLWDRKPNTVSGTYAAGNQA